MKLLSKAKDGGQKSPVDAFFLIECKSLFSIALLKFNKGGREEYHTHAFNAFTWFMCGDLIEEDVNGYEYKYTKSIKPKFTPKDKNHRVKAKKNSWCITFRGPWQKTWTEYNEKNDQTTVFTHGRKILNKLSGIC